MAIDLPETAIGRRTRAAQALLRAIQEQRATPKNLAAALRICRDPRGLPRDLIAELLAATQPEVDLILMNDETGLEKLEADESACLLRALARDEQHTAPALPDMSAWSVQEIDGLIWLLRYRNSSAVSYDVTGLHGRDRDAWQLCCSLLPTGRLDLLHSLLKGVYQ